MSWMDGTSWRGLARFAVLAVVASTLIVIPSALPDATAAHSDSSYVSITPERLIDSRPALQVGPFATPWGPAESRSIDASAAAGVPAAGLDAVAVHVTTVTPTSAPPPAFSWLTIHPTGSARPNAASINYGTADITSQITNDLVITKVDANGHFTIYNETGNTDIVIDIVGYYTTAAGVGSSYVPLTPARIIDSRAALQVGPFSSPWGAGESRTIDSSNGTGIFPPGLEAFALHVTTVTPTSAPPPAFSWLTIHPTGSARPNAASINYGTADITSQITNDLVITKVDANGQFTIYNETGNTDIVIDIVGYYTSAEGTGTDYVAVTPERVIDSRAALQVGPFATAWGPGESRTIDAFSATSVDATYLGAVAVHITTVGPTSAFSWLTIHPTGTERPNAASINYGTSDITRQITNDLIITKVDANGQFTIYNESGNTDIVIDLVGYYPLAGPPNSINGSVIADGTGLALEGIRVCALKFSISLGRPHYDQHACADSDTDGHYSLEVDFGESYAVEFFDPGNIYAYEVYDDLLGVDAIPGSAGLIRIAFDGDIRSDIDASLAVGGAIAGTVTGPDGSPLGGIEVCHYSTIGAPRLCVTTAPDGTYIVSGLEGGDHGISASDPLGLLFSTQYNDIVSVTLGATTSGIDMQLLEGALVTGTVTDESANPLEGIRVCVGSSFELSRNIYSLSGTSPGCALTESGGTYSLTITELPGIPVVQFFDPAGDYVWEFYSTLGTDVRWEFEATPVFAFPGTTSPNIDGQLAVGANITGTVTDDSANALEAIDVCLTEVNPLHYSTSFEPFCAQTGVDGSYDLRGLPPGYHPGSFADPTQLYGLLRIDQTTVLAGSTTSGVDAILSIAGTVSGTVFDSFGIPIPDATVCASSETTGGCMSTANDGTYTIAGLSPGSLRVFFQDLNFQTPGHAPEWYDDAVSLDDATPVLVISSTDTSGIDATLKEYGQISGNVTDDSDAPLAGIEVCSRFMAGEPFYESCATTDSLGDYTIQSVFSGDHQVRFEDLYNYAYATQYFDGVSDPASATLVAVVPAGTTPDIDASMSAAG